MLEEEGVIKFQAEHRARPLDRDRFGALVHELSAWRELLVRTGLMGQSPERYGGAGYGNVSARVPPFPGERGARAFLISGTQTAGIAKVGPEHFCRVRRYDAGANRVESEGPVLPSSEAMTHGAIYDLGPQIRCVLHAHTPTVWKLASALRLPTTSERVAYGTPEMAAEVHRLFRDSALADVRILAMGGHEDGIITFGRTAAEAGEVMLRHLARAYEETFRRGG
jgi:ribulose-5-phosphate 4-epimerase/fuculose-1-phosphate aldolase